MWIQHLRNILQILYYVCIACTILLIEQFVRNKYNVLQHQKFLFRKETYFIIQSIPGKWKNIEIGKIWVERLRFSVAHLRNFTIFRETNDHTWCTSSCNWILIQLFYIKTTLKYISLWFMIEDDYLLNGVDVNKWQVSNVYYIFLLFCFYVYIQRYQAETKKYHSSMAIDSKTNSSVFMCKNNSLEFLRLIKGLHQIPFNFYSGSKILIIASFICTLFEFSILLSSRIWHNIW